MQGPYLRKYGVETTINFVLYEVDGVDLRVDAADAGSDCSIMKDEGAEATCTNDFVDEGNGYSLTLDATEMQAARIVVYVIDSATKVWLDDAIVIETYGHASAMHAIDLDDGVRAGLTALPNAAADAAGGLPISDAGGLDLDAIKAATDELIVQETTIDTVETADTVFDLIAGSAQNDAYNNMIVAIIDAGDGSAETRRITDYVGADKRITIDAEITFPVAAGDAVVIYQAAYAPVGEASVSDANMNSIADKVWDEADADHMTPGTKGLKMHHSGKGRY